MRMKALLATGLMLTSAQMAWAEGKTYDIAWTVYAGTMPLGYAQDHGILKKWGDKFGFNLEAVQLNDYIEAQTQFTAGQFAASIAMTLDALTIPAASGVDTTILMPLSTSAGSDGIVLKDGGDKVQDLKGKHIHLVELSGSHYMLVRALDGVGMSEKDVQLINTSDSDIGAVFTDPSADAVVTWKPQLTAILEQYPTAKTVFDSGDIYGEIVDGLMINTELLKEEPNLGVAIAGAWYETMAMLQPTHPKYKEIMTYMADALNTDMDGLKSQLETIDFFTPAQAKEYVISDNFKQTMHNISSFAFEHGLLGEGAPSADFVGIKAGDNTVIGNKDNVKLRFPTKWIKSE